MEVIASIAISAALSYLISEMREARKEIALLREMIYELEVKIPKRKDDRDA